MLTCTAALTYDKVVVTTAKGKVYVGKLVAVEEGTFIVRTGKQGRPPHLSGSDIVKIEVAA